MRDNTNCKYWNEKGYVTTNLVDIKRISRDYCKEFGAHEFNNLYKMDKFLE